MQTVSECAIDRPSVQGCPCKQLVEPTDDVKPWGHGMHSVATLLGQVCTYCRDRLRRLGCVVLQYGLSRANPKMVQGSRCPPLHTSGTTLHSRVPLHVQVVRSMVYPKHQSHIYLRCMHHQLSNPSMQTVHTLLTPADSQILIPAIQCSTGWHAVWYPHH